MLNVTMISVIMPSVTMLNVVYGIAMMNVIYADCCDCILLCQVSFC
jgi:hypothetical protein